jgi:hypothetical protein
LFDDTAAVDADLSNESGHLRVNRNGEVRTNFSWKHHLSIDHLRDDARDWHRRLRGRDCCDK